MIPDEALLRARGTQLVLAGHVPIPNHIELGPSGEKATYLEWEWDLDPLSAPPTTRRVGSGVLGDFLTLESAPDEDILKFARTYGPLFFCFCGLPASHSFGPPSVPQPAMELWVRDILRVFDRHTSDCAIEHREDLSRWRGWSSQFKAMVEVAASLRRGRMAPARAIQDSLRPRVLFNVVNYELPSHPTKPPQILPADDDEYMSVHDPETGRTIDEQGEIIATELRELAGFAGLSAVPVWSDSKMGLTLGGSGMFSHLVRQLIGVFQGGWDFTVCTNCGTVFAPGRRRPQGRRHWCDAEECAKAARAAASRDYRSRKRFQTD